MMKGSLGVVTSILFVTAALAGCTDSSNNPAQSTGRPTGPAPPPDYDADTGAITGSVLDDEQNPIPGASVGIPALHEETLADDDGRFTLSRLAPGLHTIHAAFIGYTSDAQTVEVRAGEVTENVQLELVKLAVAEPYKDIQTQDGLFGCGAAWTPALPPEPAPALPAPLPKRVSAVAACGLAGLLQPTVNTSGLDKFLLEWHLVGPIQAWNGSVFEMFFDANQGTGRGLSMVWEVDGCINNQQGEGRFGVVGGKSPLRLVVNASKVAQIQTHACAIPNCSPEECVIISRVFATPETTGDEGSDVGFNLQQEFTQYHTAFFYEPGPDDWSVQNV